MRKTVIELKSEINSFKEALSRGEISLIAKKTGVDQSQVGRILALDFVHISPNVKKICKYAKISLNHKMEHSSKNIEDALNEVLDGSEEVERMLVNLIRSVGPMLNHKY